MRGDGTREFAAEVQAIFSERKDDLNLALDEMKDKVTNLMNAPGKDRAFHPFPVRALKGEKVAMEGHEVPRLGMGGRQKYLVWLLLCGENLDVEFLDEYWPYLTIPFWI